MRPQGQPGEEEEEEEEDATGGSSSNTAILGCNQQASG